MISFDSHIATRTAALPLALAMALAAQAAQAAGNANVQGTVLSTGHALPTGRVTAEEHAGLLRMLSRHADPVVPRRMYTASCTTGGVRKFFASITTRASAGGSYQGTIISGNVSSTGAVTSFTSKTFAACKEMSGIVADSTCSTVAALCRRPGSATGATKDLVGALPSTELGKQWKDWLTANPADDHMWLYEWKGAPANPTGSSVPNTYVVSKAIPVSEGGQHGHLNLAMTASHYGISLRADTHTLADGYQHGADNMVVVNRNSIPTNTSINVDRGWYWACASGHTLAHRPVVNTLGKFAAFCTTDQNAENGVPLHTSAVWLRVEGSFYNTAAKKAHDLFVRRANDGSYLGIYNGGGGSILANSGGGFIAVSAATPSTTSAQRTQIKLMRFDSTGTKNFETWFRADSKYFLSYPQLAYLGVDSSGYERYLVGWAQMMDGESNPSASLLSPPVANTQYLATKYFVQEIDASGNWKSAVKEVTNGWGEQDQMVSLGHGRVGWVQRPDPRWKATLPSPNSTSLNFNVYTSNTM